jgi:hypothetical protein
MINHLYVDGLHHLVLVKSDMVYPIALLTLGETSQKFLVVHPGTRPILSPHLRTTLLLLKHSYRKSPIFMKFYR